MPRNGNVTPNGHRRHIEQYDHKGKKRINNPPVGLVTPETDPIANTNKTYHYEAPVPSMQPRKELDYDPHLDPQLVWAGKKEHRFFEVPTVSLHVHERIDPYTIIKAVKKKNGNGAQPSLFERPEERRPLREEIDFYRHPHGWSNRLIAGDSMLIMNSLLQKEGMAGQVQMVYIDPPYGIKYGSNFQPFVNKRDVRDGKDEDLTQEPEMIRAFRDTWELGIHSYLTYLRDRLLLALELLHDSGSCFVQISDENVHFVRSLMDDVFGSMNFISLIFVAKTSGFGQTLTLSSVGDYLVWYAKDRKTCKYRQLYSEKGESSPQAKDYRYALLANDDVRTLSLDEIIGKARLPQGERRFSLTATTAQGGTERGGFPVYFKGKIFRISEDQHWKTSEAGMKRLILARRIRARENSLRYVRFLDDFPAVPITNNWIDLRWGFDAGEKRYVVETNPGIIARCLLMTTDPGDLVFDPTCGSGTTAYAAEQWGRRWITCDTSRVAVTLAKQRLMTSEFDYYELAYPEEGVSSGFRYKTVPHVTLKSIANNPEIHESMTREQIEAAIAKYADQETLYDRPNVDRARVRVTGPFTAEAVPAPTVRPLGEIETDQQDADVSISRRGATVRHSEWREELLKTGIRGKAGQKIKFSRVESMSGTRWIHADAEIKEKGLRVVVSFGPIDAPLEQRQIALAWEEARTILPRPSMIVFAAFHFDPEAAKDIDELTPEKTGMIFLKVQMNTDLLTDDLKKKRSSNQSFWLIGQPDFELRKIKSGEHQGKYQVELFGFDYYNTVTGELESGDTSKIAAWFLDTDYDGRSLFPRQVFFPMANGKDGWSRLAKNLKTEIDPKAIEAYKGTVSLPFDLGENGRVAVKIIDNRGVESLRIENDVSSGKGKPVKASFAANPFASKSSA